MPNDQAHDERREDLLRMRGAPRSAGSTACTPRVGPVPAPLSAVAHSVDLLKWPAHPAESGGGTLPSTLPILVLFQCCAGAVFVPQLRRPRRGARFLPPNCGSGVAPNHRSCSKAARTEWPRIAGARLAAGTGAPAKAVLDPDAVHVAFHRPKQPAARRRGNPIAPDFGAS